MINKKALGQMKKGVMIINTGRGGLINTKALLEGLKSGEVGSAGLDVYEEESEYFGGWQRHLIQSVLAVPPLVRLIDEVVVDRETMHLTHLVLREGHLWGQKDVMIPVDEIENIEENNVYLKLDKQSVAALPTFPVHRHIQH